jgi:hypothetical protein
LILGRREEGGGRKEEGGEREKIKSVDARMSTVVIQKKGSPEYELKSPDKKFIAEHEREKAASQKDRQSKKTSL